LVTRVLEKFFSGMQEFILAKNKKWSQRKMRGFTAAYDDLMDMFKERYNL